MVDGMRVINLCKRTRVAYVEAAGMCVGSLNFDHANLKSYISCKVEL